MSHIFKRSAVLSLVGIGAAAAVALPQFALAGDGVPSVTPTEDLQDWVLNENFLTISDTNIMIRTWDQMNAIGEQSPHFAVSHDAGATWTRDRETSYNLTLRYSDFDPLVTTPAIHPDLQATDANNLHIVQFIAPPMQKFRNDIETLGGTIRHFVGNHGYVVEMDDLTKDAIQGLEYVRWVGAFHPAYKTEEWVLNEYFPMGYGAAGQGVGLNGADQGVMGAQDIDINAPLAGLGFNQGNAQNEEPIVLTFNVAVFERGFRQKKIVARKIKEMGGTIERMSDQGFLVRATFDVAKIGQLLTMDEIEFVDLTGPPEHDMNIARDITGSLFIENTLGFTGQGVNFEVMDSGNRTTHEGFEGEIIIHGGNGSSTWHGTAVSGIVYGDFIGQPANAEGTLRDANKKIFACYSCFSDRHAHTAELSDPGGAYRAVMQTNSWGSPRTRDYNTTSADLDDILFLNDIVICQSQSNAGNQDSRPQAWSKNMVSVGGVNHYGTADKADDCWCSGGSIGPARDGRIKPDLTHFYDNIHSTEDGHDSDYMTGFGGTSGATPIVAGHIGLIFQMWHEGVFDGFGGGVDVFENRPKAATAKALVINSAEQYAFSGSNHDHARVKQGWGMPSLEALYNLADTIFIVDETDVLTENQSTQYNVTVTAGMPELKATLVYTDYKGSPSNQSQHRVNDLSLKVTAPNGTVYWGNNGLLTENYSTPGGVSNTKDTVENVFVENPMGGNWTVEVFADEINQDTHLETGAVDADYALVVTPVGGIAPACMDLTVTNLIENSFASFTVTQNLSRGERVAVVYGTQAGETVVDNLAGYCGTFGFKFPLGQANKHLVVDGFADIDGIFQGSRKIPNGTAGMDIMFQAIKHDTCPSECMSQVWSGTIE